MKLDKIIDEIIDRLPADIAFALGAGTYESDAVRRFLVGEGLEEEHGGYTIRTSMGSMLRDALLARIERAYPEPVVEPEPNAAPAGDDADEEPATNVLGLTAGAVASLREQPTPEPLPHGWTQSDARKP